jgi:pyruvate dehydrogenase E2 component (dihydrolipoamide acetyltransferase)
MATSASQRIFASPLARRLARDNAVSLAHVVGTGPNGRIVKHDILDRVQARQQPAPAAPAPLITFHMAGTAHVDALIESRDRINAISAHVSLNDLIIKAVAHTFRRVPEMNVLWTDGALVTPPSVSIGVPIASAKGSVTPVIRDADKLTVREIASLIRDLKERADDGLLRQHELEGGVCTVSNLGMFGVQAYAAIINPPQSSIIAVGAARKEPMVIDDKLAIGSMIRFVLSVDQRTIDGAVAARWMQAFTAAIANPLSILA